MNIIVDLQDHENKSHQAAKLEFSDQETIDQLKQKILSIFLIDKKYQEITDNNDRRIDLLDGPIENLGIIGNEKLILRHSELPWWKVYKVCVDIAMKPGPGRLLNAQEAVRLHRKLIEKDFFDAYPEFNMFRMKNHFDVASWIDGYNAPMKEATLFHFRAQHFKRGADDESDFTCRFETRPEELGGSRKNTLACVQLHGEKKETKYNVKCHHFASSSSRSKGQLPDINEFFCYKLLELINVGPHAQFILPNKSIASKTSMYIATKWNDNFVPMSSTEKENVSEEVLVQLVLLGMFLFIDDLHSDNCGHWKDTKEAAIVDFMPRYYMTYADVKKALRNNYFSEYWEHHQIDALEKLSEESRMEIAKESLKKWDLLSKIDIASEQIKLQADRMKQHGIRFRGFTSPTEELDEYIKAIKKNLLELTDKLNVAQ